MHEVRLRSLAGATAPGLLLAAVPLVPTWPYLTLLAGVVGMALGSPRLRPRFRHASESGKLAAIFGSLIVPAVLAYPSIVHHGLAAKQRLIEEEIAPATASHPAALLDSLSRTQREVDALLARAAPGVRHLQVGGRRPDPRRGVLGCGARPIWPGFALRRPSSCTAPTGPS